MGYCSQSLEDMLSLVGEDGKLGLVIWSVGRKEEKEPDDWIY